MRVCIYGAGAMGTSLGVHLDDSPLVDSIDFVTRNEERVEYLNEYGATVRGVYENLSVKALTPDEMKGEYDVIILATKQRENAKTAEFLLPFLGEDGAVITVQNGLPERELAAYFGADRVYGATLSWGAELSGGEVIVTSTSGYFIGFGAYGKGERYEELAKLLSCAGTVTGGNLTELRFAKLAVNAAFSTLSCISDLDFYTLAKKYRRQVNDILSEVFAVAKACGCQKLPLNRHDLFKVFGKCTAITLPIAMKKYKNTKSGMLADIKSGRHCDIDFVAGAAIAAGREKGVATPNLERAVALVHDIENGLAEISPETLRLLR